MPSLQRGEMAEWSKAHAWKACELKGSEGSNPSLSATQMSHFPVLREFIFTPIFIYDIIDLNQVYTPYQEAYINDN